MENKSDGYRNFWEYISQNQKDLIMEGEYLLRFFSEETKMDRFRDYSFLVFPFAKAYEGFLKKLFLDVKFISHLDYISDHLRLGKLMSPNLVDRLGDKSLYKQIKEKTTKEFVEKVWMTWKMGRNQIFHYFPHNVKAISYKEACDTVNQIIQTMEEAYTKLKTQKV